MSSSDGPSAAGEQIDVTSLSPPELLEVRKQLSEELQHLTSSYGQLRSVQASFTACISALSNLPSDSAAASTTPTLIPLTSSLYVPGKLTDPDRVIVDVGTGYYVGKSRQEARKMYTEKVKYVEGNLETLQATIERKQENLQVVGRVLQMKTSQANRGSSSQQQSTTA